MSPHRIAFCSVVWCWCVLEFLWPGKTPHKIILVTNLGPSCPSFYFGGGSILQWFIVHACILMIYGYKNRGTHELEKFRSKLNARVARASSGVGVPTARPCHLATWFLFIYFFFCNFVLKVVSIGTSEIILIWNVNILEHYSILNACVLKKI